MSKVWSGDVDLADGELQRSYDAYQEQLQFCAQIGLPPRDGRRDIIQDLQKALAMLTHDLEVISTCKFV